MTIKIIPNPNNYLVVTCKCNAVLQYKTEDMILEKYEIESSSKGFRQSKTQFQHWKHKFINCPNCKNKVVLSKIAITEYQYKNLELPITEASWLLDSLLKKKK